MYKKSLRIRRCRAARQGGACQRTVPRGGSRPQEDNQFRSPELPGDPKAGHARDRALASNTEAFLYGYSLNPAHIDNHAHLEASPPPGRVDERARDARRILLPLERELAEAGP